MAKIQLLIADNGDRDAVAKLVAERHSPITTLEFHNADLHIVDEPSLERYRADLEARQRNQRPLFCPVILVRDPRTPAEVSLGKPDLDDRVPVVDQIIQAPIDRQILFRQIESLLLRRQQMAELHEKQRMELFAKTLRHELRNPLQVLDAWLEIADEANSAGPIDKCRRAVDQMKRLLDETLVILERGDLPIDPEPLDLDVQARKSWEMVPLSGGTLRVETDRTVEADADRFTQLLTNLFRNAIEHGGSELTVTVVETTDGFAVEDDGPGIPAPERKTVLEEGYSTDRSNSGLGLAVVSAIASAHDWDFVIRESDTGGARLEFSGVSGT